MGDDNGSTPQRALVVHNEALLEVIKRGLADCGIESETLSCDTSAPPVVGFRKNTKKRNGVVSALIDARNNVRIAMSRVREHGRKYDFVLCGCNENEIEKEKSSIDELLFLISLCAERHIPCLVFLPTIRGCFVGRIRILVSTCPANSFEGLKEKSQYSRWPQGDPTNHSFWAQVVLQTLDRTRAMELWDATHTRRFRLAYYDEQGREWEFPRPILYFPSLLRRSTRGAARNAQQSAIDPDELSQAALQHRAQASTINRETHNRLKKREAKNLKIREKPVPKERKAKPKGNPPISHKKTTKTERKDQKRRMRDERKRFLKKQRKNARVVKSTERERGLVLLSN